MSSRSDPGSAPLPAEAVEVRRLLARANSKAAVETAKILHKRVGTPASEGLLVEAYVERVRSMLAHGMVPEAEAVVAMVRQRYPASVARLEAIRGALARAGGGLEEVVRPLADPAAPAEARAAAERAIRTGLADPAALAACAALAADHPLRLGAEAVRRALEAVTSGPVDDDALALPEISRKSPLAPWKSLVRAIACFYRSDDAGCEQSLQAIDPESAPARLVPALRAMLAGQPSGTLSERVCGDLGQLRGLLSHIDAVGLEDGPRFSASLMRQSLSLAEQECPEILPALRRQLAVRAAFGDFSPKAVAAALGGQPKMDARYYLALARALEHAGEGEVLSACQNWEEFRKAAVRERWFPERGPEVATVYLHVAELAGAVDPDELREVYREASMTLRDLAGEAFPMPDAEMFPYLNPESLFEQACAMDPNPGAFQRWVDWAGERDDSAAVRAAEAWRRALPQDPRPLLCLMRHAEKRQALKKALSYLRDAELLDGVSSEVRRARLRLLVNGAFRHIQQGKWRLALPELDELEALPQAREGDRLVFIAALRYFACSRAGDAAGVAATLRNIEQSIGSIAAALLLSSAGSLCGGSYGVEAGKLSGGWIEALLRVRDIGLDMGYSIRFDAGFRPRILHELWSAPATDLDSLFKLAAIAVKQQWRDVAYVISTAGLTRPDPREGHFLLLRARALPDLELRRAEDCIRAAFTLARRNNDSALAQSAIELWREMRLEGPFNVDPGLMDNRKLDKLLQRERLRVKPPQYGAWDLHGGLELASSPRRKPRRSRRRPFESDAELPF